VRRMIGYSQQCIAEDAGSNPASPNPEDFDPGKWNTLHRQ